MPLTQRSRVSELREQAGLTQVQLAALVGVTPNTIQNWEKPNGLKQLERYLKMAELFGCEVKDLVEYVEVQGKETEEKPRGFSLEEIRELRERWGTSTKTTALASKEQVAGYLSLPELSARYDLTPRDFEEVLSVLREPLKLEPEEFDGTLYLTTWQVDLLDSLKSVLTDAGALNELLRHLKDGTFIYQCSACGELHLTEKILQGKQLLHSCDLSKLKSPLSTVCDLSPKGKQNPAGRFQLIASGSLDHLALWLQSLHLGLDSPRKSI